ncbi:X2-like carbohydrate binding domain-containing protein [Paenibacillus solisilvae]|uniref:Alpha-galactosidase n=1 Tax=Paenibacillus solisilvae TaxID=2486751 RepID=A0ABW0VUN8_9BACL
MKQGMRTLCLSLLLAALVIAPIGLIPPKSNVAEAADNGLAQKPLMGWSSYSLQVYNENGIDWVTADRVKAQSDAMHQKLQPYGYNYINIDAGWNGGFDEYGRPQPKESLYPKGIQEVIDYVHHNGQKIGLYTIPGLSKEVYDKNLPIYGTPYHAQDIVQLPLTTADYWGINYKIDFSKPGAKEYIKSVADQFGKWGIDFLKFDSVTPGSGHNNTAIDARDEVAAMSESLKPYHIWLELSWALDHNYADTWKKYANGWRIEWDIESYSGPGTTLTKWENIARLFPDAALWWRDAGPGGWNDFDSLNIGNGSMDGLTKDERRTAMTFWAVSAAQLYIGNDMTNLDDYGLSLLTNPEVIAVNQAGRPAHPLSITTNQQVWYSNNGDGTFNVALFNLDNKPAAMNVNFSDIGLEGKAAVRDLWSRKKLDSNATGLKNIILEPHASRLFKITAKNGKASVNDDESGMKYTGSWTRNGGSEQMADKQDLSVAIVDGSAQNATASDRYLMLNDDDSGIIYSNGWSRNSGRSFGDYFDDVHYSENNGEYLEYTFKGTGIQYITELDPSQGDVDIYLDGQFQQTVNTFAAQRSAQQAIYKVSGLSDGFHTIKAVKKSGTFMLLDALKVQLPDLINVSAAEFDKSTQADLTVNVLGNIGNLGGITNGSAALTNGIDYSINGNAVTIKKEYLAAQPAGTTRLTFVFKGDYQNDVHAAAANGDYYEYTFTGTGIDVIAPKGPNLGEMDIYIDGARKATVNAYSQTRSVQQSLFSVSKLKNSSHTIRVVKKSGELMIADMLKFIVS